MAVNLHLNASDAISKIKEMESQLSPAQYQKLLRSTLVDVGRKAKGIIGDYVVEDYVVAKKWVTNQVGHPEVSSGLTVIVPVRGSRGGIGMVYPIAGQSGSSKRRRIYAKIVKSGVTTLPGTMRHQGGNPPFVAKGAVYTRKTKGRRPIVRVVGLGVPQMPMNRSREKIENELVHEMERSAMRHFGRLFGGEAKA